MYAERSAGEGCEDIPGETEHREDKGTGETRRCCPEADEAGDRLLRCRRSKEPRIGRQRIRANHGERTHSAAQSPLIDDGGDHTTAHNEHKTAGSEASLRAGARRREEERRAREEGRGC